MKTVKVDKPTHGSLEWLKIRHRDEQGRIRFGASEAPILMGVSKFKDIVDLAIEKWADPEVKEQNEAMMRGHLLEPALLEYASTLLGEPVTTPEEMFVNERFIATLDGLVGDVIVEAKTTTFYSSDDVLPEDYYWQVIAQLACVPQATRALVVVLDKRMRFGYWEFYRSAVEDDITLLLDRAAEVGELLDKGEMPFDAEPTETQVKLLFPDPVGQIELTHDQVQVIEMWSAAKQALKESESVEQNYKDQVARMLGEAEEAHFCGQKLVTFKARKGVSRLDTKRLEQDHPDLVAKYKVTGQGTRILRTTLGGN